MLSFAFGSGALTILACGAASPVELLLVSFGEKAGARGLGLVVDLAEDGAYVLGRVFVRMTGFAACVDEVGDLLWKLPVEAGLRAPTGIEILAQTGVVETLGRARHYQDECNLLLSGRVCAQQQ